MVEYLSGNRIQGSSTLTSSPPQTSWKELDRVTLGSTSTSFGTTFADKDNIMVLLSWSRESGASADPNLQLGDTSADTGSNYARRLSANGGTDSTNTSADYVSKWATGAGSDVMNFQQIQFSNIANQEKLGIEHGIFSGGTGAGTTPNRTENVFKWANTSAQAGYIRYHAASGTTFSAGSEIVVLGCDNDEADSGTNFWQELADVELSSGTSNTIDTGTFTAKKYLYLEFYSIPSGSQSYSVMRFNLDEGNNYASRYSTNGGTDAHHGGNNYILFYAPLNNSERFMSAFIVNNSSKEKLVVGEGVSQNTAGAGNAPERRELTGKWANTSNSITSIQMHSDSDDDNPSRLFAAGTRVKVWGSD
jgi:hypothetical protein